MAKTFTKSSKPTSKMVDTSAQNPKSDKQSIKKTKVSKTPVKIQSDKQSIKNKIFVENKHQFVANDEQIDKGFTRKSSRVEKVKSFEFVDKNDEQNEKGFSRKSPRVEKVKSFQFVDKKGEKGKMGNLNKKGSFVGKKNEKGKMGNLDKDSRDEKGSSLEFVEKNEKSRMPIKISAFEKMKMRKNEEMNKIGFGDGVGLLEKKKRSVKMNMKIHRYDVSNKRLDDGDALADITNKQKKKKNEEEAKDESGVPGLSMNAQFRAIKPSPSIITFVQENFLGRRREIELQRAGYNMELPAPLDNLPFSTSSEREKVEENIFRSKMQFFAAAKVATSFPPPNLPEIAFAGRSNVGKSSLLNALTRQWGVVRTSDKPGHTQSINFFDLGSKLTMVDLPGYGFAYAKDEVKEAWEDLVKEYVSTRVGLKRVCLLVDTKWGMKPRDIELIHLMERSQTQYQVVLTKTDVVFPIDVARRAMQIEETLKEHKSIVKPVMMVSSKSGAGIRCLRTVLGKMSRFLKP